MYYQIREQGNVNPSQGRATMNSQCTNLTTLARYITNKLLPDEKEAFENHLSTCDFCLGEFAMARHLLDQTDLFPHPAAHCLKTVYLWMSEAIRLETSSQLSFAMLRNTGTEPTVEGIEFCRDIGDLRQEMWLEKKSDAAFSIRIMVFEGEEPARQVRLTLTRLEGGMRSRPLKGTLAYFEDLPFGTYCLELKKQSKIEDVMHFVIDQEGLKIASG